MNELDEAVEELTLVPFNSHISRFSRISDKECNNAYYQYYQSRCR